MFIKNTVRVLLITVAVFGVNSLFSTPAQAAALCSTNNPDLGINASDDGPNAHAYSGLIVHAFDAESGNELNNRSYTLSTTGGQQGINYVGTENGHNFTWVRSSSHGFQTGDPIYRGSDGPPINCSGYTAFGYGSYESWGNRYVLSCSDNGVPVRYRITGISPDGPGAGHWQIMKSIPGEGWQEVGPSGFLVSNGNNTYVRLIWRRDRPVEASVSLSPQAGIPNGGPSGTNPEEISAGSTLDFTTSHRVRNLDGYQYIYTFLNIDKGNSAIQDIDWINPVNGDARDNDIGQCFYYRNPPECNGNPNTSNARWRRGPFSPQTDVDSDRSYGVRIRLRSSIAPGTVICFRAHLVASDVIRPDERDPRSDQRYLDRSQLECYQIRRPPNIVATKSANPASNTAVKAGQRIDFKIRATNAGGTTSSPVGFEDYIPLNINPSTVRVDYVRHVFSGFGFNDACLNGPMNSPGLRLIGAQCSLITGFSGPTKPPKIIFSSDRFFGDGAYVEIGWHGNVVASNQVGVYPTDDSYCANPTDWRNRGSNTTHADDGRDQNNVRRGTSCENYFLGRQAVSNFARVQMFYPFGAWRKSNFTINPIPGGLKCIEKTANLQEDETAAPVPNGCGDGSKRPYLYSPTEVGLDSFTITLRTEPDTAKTGPIDYDVDDQRGLASLPPGMNYNGFHSENTGQFNIALAANLRHIRWDLGIIKTGLFNFGVKFDAATSPPIDSVYANVAEACWYDFSAPGVGLARPRPCVVTVPTVFRHIKVVGPGLRSNRGNVYAGGTITTSDAPCRNASPSKIKVNPTSTSEYVVAQEDALPGSFNSEIGVNIGGYAFVCRDDIVGAVEKIATKSGAVPFRLPADGEAVNMIPGSHITTSNVTTRGTLYSPGDIYIDGNIYAISAGDRGSLGIAAARNIFISPTVTRIDAYLVAGAKGNPGTIYTCNNGSGNGSAPTCKQRLDVNGLLLAKNINFGRTTVASSGDCPKADGSPGPCSEVVTFLQRLYTLTPPGFGNLYQGYNPPTFQGELRPRY